MLGSSGHARKVTRNPSKNQRHPCFSGASAVLFPRALTRSIPRKHNSLRSVRPSRPFSLVLLLPGISFPRTRVPCLSLLVGVQNKARTAPPMFSEISPSLYFLLLA